VGATGRGRGASHDQQITDRPVQAGQAGQTGSAVRLSCFESREPADLDLISSPENLPANGPGDYGRILFKPNNPSSRCLLDVRRLPTTSCCTKSICEVLNGPHRIDDEIWGKIQGNDIRHIRAMGSLVVGGSDWDFIGDSQTPAGLGTEIDLHHPFLSSGYLYTRWCMLVLLAEYGQRFEGHSNSR
jgi:hypothetical protein